MRNTTILLCCLFFLGCKAKDGMADGNGHPQEAKQYTLEEQKVIDIAKRESKKSGLETEKLDVHLDMSPKEGIVFFSEPGKSISLLTVWVDPTTGKVLHVGKPYKSNSYDPEEKRIVDAAIEEAKKLGYDIKKYEVNLDMHGKDSTVHFNIPKTDVCALTVWVDSETGKVLTFKKEKN